MVVFFRLDSLFSVLASRKFPLYYHRCLLWTCFAIQTEFMYVLESHLPALIRRRSLWADSIVNSKRPSAEQSHLLYLQT
jgi:hypothetical protein